MTKIMTKGKLNMNEVTILQVKKAINKLGLTLEGLFRHCDFEQKGFLKTADFSKFLMKVKHSCSKQMISKFISLIDEENVGII